jgi:hypothetical protein
VLSIVATFMLHISLYFDRELEIGNDADFSSYVLGQHREPSSMSGLVFCCNLVGCTRQEEKSR